MPFRYNLATCLPIKHTDAELFNILPRVSKPISRRGCIEILGASYLQQFPLPRIPNYREPSLGNETLPRTPNYYVANTAWSKPSMSVPLNGKKPFSIPLSRGASAVEQAIPNGWI